MKKRILSLLLTVCMLLSMVPAGALSAAAENNVLYGDADGSGQVDLMDVNLIERYLAGEKTAVDTIRLKNADVNADGAVDRIDVRLLKEYLVGNTLLAPELCTLSFDTDGAGAMPAIRAGKGYPYQGSIPIPAKDGFLFVKWVREDGSTYYQDSDAVTGDVTLKAVYAPVDLQQSLQINSFSMTNQPEDVTVAVAGKYATAEEAANHITLVPKDGSDPVKARVVKTGDGLFTVTAAGGFLPGGSYALTLDDTMHFADRDPMYRTAYLIIRKGEYDNLQFNDKVIFIQDTDQMNYTVNGKTTPVLESALLSNDQSREPIRGVFTMPGSSLKVGDIVCIYESVHPNHRDYTKDDYDDDALAYVRITGLAAGGCQFESLNEEDTEEVIAMPDSIPYRVDALPTAGGTVNKNDYDAYARAQLGETEAPKFQVHDFLVFYTGSFEETKKQSNAVYGQITAVDGDIVTYQIVTKDAIENFMGMFVSQELKTEQMLENVDQQKLLDNIQLQAENSGFVERAAQHMVQTALETGEVQQKLRYMGVSEAEIMLLSQTPVPLSARAAPGRPKLVVEGISVGTELIKGKRFENGLGVALEVCLTLSVDTKMGMGKISSLKIDLSASFEEELSVGFDINVEDRWEWYGPFPVLEDLDVNVAVDIQNYTSVSVGAKIFTIFDETGNKKWKKLSETTGPNASPQLRERLRKIDSLQAQVKKLKARGEDVAAILEEIQGYKDQLPKVTVDGVEYSIEQLEEALGGENVSESFDEVFSAKTKQENKVGMEQLMNRYQEMLNQETDWVEIFNQNLFEKEIQIKVVAINIRLDLVVRGNVNVSIGADMEYQVGKRYNFWIHVMDLKSGSSEMDLLDERFGFQFYVMGTLGLKVGIKAELAIGIISTRIASVGASVEFGPYLRLWGYFIYLYERTRPANTSQWKENTEMMGAMYVEFGLYVMVKFKAQAFDNLVKYEPTLYDQEFPLLTAGVRQNVYDFAVHPGSDDILYIEDADANSLNGITMPLPSLYQNMKTIDLRSGEKAQKVYPKEKFYATFTDSRFSMDDQGVIHVDVPEGTRFMKCDMRVVWKCDKLAFSKYDTDITVPVVWTNYTDTERSEKFTASVAVGNPTDGYHTVWSGRYSRLDAFDLPSEQEILNLLHYDSYAFMGGNLKYASVDGYQEAHTGQSITSDRVYYFNITPRIYTMTVRGVHNADGSTKDMTFRTTFGNSFDLRNLLLTGKNNPETWEYTTFRGLKDSTGAEVEGELLVNMSFAEKYGADSVFNAVYQDDALTATYVFVGLGNQVEPFTVRFKKGAVPGFDGVNEYIRRVAGEGATIRSISPDFAPSESSLTYVVQCDIAVPAPTHSLHFDSQGGSSVTSQVYSEGAIIFGRVTDPTRDGYNFSGWYQEPECVNPFVFGEEMPNHDVTVYAKWTPKTYEVSFSQGFGQAPDPVTVTYGQPYGQLPVPKDDNYKFLGWFTAADGGVEITAESIFREKAHQTLYAHWVEKKDFDPAWIQYSKPQTSDYNEGEHTFAFSLTNVPAELKSFFQVLYVKEGNSSANYSEQRPVDAGTYNVKLIGPLDNDDYKRLPNEVFISGAMRINRIHMVPGGRLPEPKMFGNKGAISISLPDGVKGDGRVRYILDSPNGRKENDTGFFSNCTSGNHVGWVIVEEGTNYYRAESPQNSVLVSGRDPGTFQVKFRIWTTDGTDADIYGAALTHDGQTGQIALDSKGNDFEKGDDVIYIIADNMDPWEITGGYIDKQGNNLVGNWDNWSFGSKFRMTGGGYVYEEDFLSGNNVGEYQKMVKDYGSAFARKITAVGNFYQFNSTLDLNGSVFHASYDGMVTDDVVGTYNAMAHFDAPIYNIEANQREYQNFVHRTGVTSFSIDTPALREYLMKFGGPEPWFNVTLQFPERSTQGGRYDSRVITCTNLPANVSDTASTQAVTRYEAPAVVSDGTAPEFTMTLDPMQIALNRGKTFEVAMNIGQDVPVWGILGSAKYDTELFELVGCTAGDLFTQEQFTLQKDLTASPYRFLATLDTLNTISSQGNFVKLQFKVKDDAPDRSTVISIDTLEAVNREAPVSALKGEGVQVITDSTAPILDGLTDGETYYGPVKVTVQEDNLKSLKVNGQEVTLENGEFTLQPADGLQTVEAEDTLGNRISVTVTVKEDLAPPTGVQDRMIGAVALVSLLSLAAAAVTVTEIRRKRR